MKRLFTLKHQDEKLVLDSLLRQPYYFNSKKEAKAARDQLNDNLKVSTGPDHWRNQK